MVSSAKLSLERIFLSSIVAIMKPPLSADELLELYFIETRHKLLDVAAFLDRMERSGVEEDFRLKALKDAIPLLENTGAKRCAAILELFSDHSEVPIEKAPGKGAAGAVPLSGDAE